LKTSKIISVLVLNLKFFSWKNFTNNKKEEVATHGFYPLSNKKGECCHELKDIWIMKHRREKVLTPSPLIMGEILHL
jgi:hypothetical protein